MMPREIMSKPNMKIVAKLFGAALFVFMCLAMALPQAQTPSAEDSLRAFLQMKADDKETRYVVVLRDLNGDGKPEAVAYLFGNDWCGSGGCNLFVLRRNGDSWKVVSSITTTDPPVQVLTNTSNGWRDLRVYVRGGAARPGATMTLRFDGKRYRKIPLAAANGKNVSGEMIIRSSDAGKPPLLKIVRTLLP
jgi:hypothetical protein